MLNQELEFEKGKWYYFKDDAAEAEFRKLNSHNIRNPNNSSIADIIVNSEGFCPVRLAAGYVMNVDLAYGDNTDMVLYPSERKFFTEMVVVDSEDEWAEDGFSEDEDTSEDAAPFEPSDFPLTKITISNNSEAWSVFQMLKAHFKE
ncbi:putative RNA metabolism modulator [Escherichia phage vB_EcoM-E33]|nr:putative RNA metabolism modulator [Escherichia phage vB_EcoM-E33]